MLEGFKTMHIEKVENGYIVSMPAGFPASKIFVTLSDLLDFIKKYWELEDD